MARYADDPLCRRTKMTDEPDSLTLRVLRRIEAKIDRCYRDAT
jgi:hypothetical protein